jgi:TonB family protein
MAEEAKGHTGPSRRRVERFDLQAPLDVTVLRSGIPDIVPGRTVDVSEGGIAAMLAGELTPGETVGLQMQLPAMADPLRTRAKVKYQQKLRCGLEFLWLSAEERQAIRESVKSGQSGIAVSVGPLRSKAEKQKPEKEQTGKEKSAVHLDGEEESGQGASQAFSQGPPEKRSENTPRRKTIFVVFFMLALVVVAAVGWWRWNRGWEELESGLKPASAASAERPQVQVAAEVMEKLLVHRVEPVYPAEARRANLQGVIALDIVVARDGSVADMRALNGPDVLARAAMDALRWWRFEPYRVNGEPAAVETTVAVEFKQ